MAAVPRPAEVIQKDIHKVMKEIERVNKKDLWDEFWGEWDDDLQELLRELEVELAKGAGEPGYEDAMLLYTSEEREEILQRIPLRKRRASAPAVVTPPSSPPAVAPEAEKTK
jgi:hypothetical protein